MSNTRNHHYDQHFLKNPRIVAELVGHSNIRKNDIVYDLGAGSGIISYVLSPRCKKVYAVENEPVAVQKLKMNLRTNKNVEIVDADIRRYKPVEQSYKVFANIPFSLSAEIIKSYCSLSIPPKAMYFITQRQFAKKLVPGSDHFTNALSAQIGPWFSVKIKKPLKNTDFTPPPAVDTVLLEVKLRETARIDTHDQFKYWQWIELCFHDKAFFLGTARTEASISSEKSPSQLTLDEWIKLYEVSR